MQYLRGADTLDGGAGINTLDFSAATSASTINLASGTTGYVTDTISNFTKFIGSNYGDTITGTTGSDSITGGTGADYIYATTGCRYTEWWVLALTLLISRMPRVP